jgi:ATP-dependent RNA helicase DDX10/DBP4
MFERKNQNILSEHYNRMIDRSEDHLSQDENGLLNGANDDDEDDFMTLKRTNHELPDSLRDPEASVIAQENISKRKARLLKTKKGLVKLKGSLGKKVVFDDEGIAHDAYAIKEADAADLAIREAGRAFAERERDNLKEADIDDKQLAKAKRQEKKRKRKEREAAVSMLFMFQIPGRKVIITDAGAW